MDKRPSCVGDPRTFPRVVAASQGPRGRANRVATARYTVWTFAPLFLYEQFHRLANVYFLVVSCLQLVPGLSPTGRYTTLGPLCAVLLATAVKAAVEDRRRHRDDAAENSRTVRLLGGEMVPCESLQAGGIVVIRNGETAPCDGLALHAEAASGAFGVNTAQLDGETVPKARYAAELTQRLGRAALCGAGLRVLCAEPSPALEQFEGVVEHGDAAEPVTAANFVARGSRLCAAGSVVLLALYVGRETKQSLNARPPTLKRSRLDRKTNGAMLAMAALAVGLAAFCAISSRLADTTHPVGPAPLPAAFGTFFILFNNLVPVSLYVCLEVVRTAQARQIERGVTGCRCRNSALVEELGCVRHILADKTGTLTKNRMTVRRCYADGKEHASLPTGDLSLALVTCHAATTADAGFEASSSEEVAFLEYARAAGVIFRGRTAGTVETSLGTFRTIPIPFTPERRRMSVLLLHPDGRVQLLTKGADTVVASLCASHPADTLSRAHAYAQEGLRTLLFASRTLSHDEVANLARLAQTGALTTLERDLACLGCVAVEDELQDGVETTVSDLRTAGLAFCVVTGDQLETARAVATHAGILRGGSTDVLLNGADVAERAERDPAELAELLARPSVCVYRCTPQHKALVAELLGAHLVQGVATLAVGDGANDVAMIRTAHVGVGVVGAEGTAAARAADFSVMRFEALRELLLVHGRHAFLRSSLFTQHTLYRCLLLFAHQLFFAFLSAFSGTSVFERWSLVMYNVLFASLLPLVVALTDEDRDAAELLRHPQHYHSVPTHFTTHTICCWLACALVQSATIFVTAFLVLHGNEFGGHGEVSVHDFGLVLYTATTVIAQIHLASYAHTFSRAFIAAAAASCLLFVGWFVGYGSLGALTCVSVGETMFMAFLNIASTPLFWVLIPLLLAIPSAVSALLRFFRDVQERRHDMAFLHHKTL